MASASTAAQQAVMKPVFDSASSMRRSHSLQKQSTNNALNIANSADVETTSKRSNWRKFFQASALATAILLAWLFAGAVAFSYLESSSSTRTGNEAMTDNDELINLPISLPENGIFNATALVQILADSTNSFAIVTSSDSLITIRRNKEQSQRARAKQRKQWDFAGSLFFCITVVTTIGYGNFAPQTVPGRLLAVIYAIIGIPLMAIVMVNIGNIYIKLAILIDQGLTKISLRRHNKQTKQEMTAAATTDGQNEGFVVASTADQNEEEKEEEEEIKEPSWKAFLILSVSGLAFFVYLFSIFLSYVEDWNYRATLYYCYITLSTIGFGDMIAGMNENGEEFYGGFYISDFAYRITLSLWLFFGISFLGLVMSRLQKQIEFVIACVTNRLG